MNKNFNLSMFDLHLLWQYEKHQLLTLIAFSIYPKIYVFIKLHWLLERIINIYLV